MGYTERQKGEAMLKKVGLVLALISGVVSSGIVFESFRSLNQLSEFKLNSENQKNRESASIAVATPNMVPFLSLDELFANLTIGGKNHTLSLKMDIEFFDPEAKQEFKSRQGVVRNLILETSREQKYQELSSLAGKLYYKELLIRRMNEYFQKPMVKDVHFASFFLQ